MKDAGGDGQLIIIARQLLGAIWLVSAFIEMLFFPSIENFYGCMMSGVAYLVFLLVFTDRYIRNYPFSFFALLPLFFYRYLPLPATLLEWKPVSYGMQLPFWTFFGETFMFVIIVCAFYLACQAGERRNNFLRQFLKVTGVFQMPSATAVWGLGFLGMFCYAYSLFSGMEVGKTGSAGNILLSFAFLKDAPMLLLFPNLTGSRDEQRSRMPVIVYFCLQIVVTLAANSRHMIIAPILLFVFLMTLNIVKMRYALRGIFSVWKMSAVVVGGYVLLGVISDVSVAMLYTRAIRSDVSRQELFWETYAVYTDKEFIAQLKSTEKLGKGGQTLNYSNGWTEDYLDNFLLNRFCNVRITDIGLYYATLMDVNSTEVLVREYFGRVVALLPSLFIGSGGVKDYLNYSPGDRIYGLAIRSEAALGSRVVISDLSDGWATFGVLFFPYYFLLRFAFFKLLNALCYVRPSGVLSYSPIGLILIYDVFLAQTNVNGSVGVLFFSLRTLWQYLVIWVACRVAVEFVVRSFGWYRKEGD